MTSVKPIVEKNIVHTKLKSGSPMFGRRLTFNSGKNKECFLSVINVWFMNKILKPQVGFCCFEQGFVSFRQCTQQLSTNGLLIGVPTVYRQTRLGDV